MGDIKKLVTRMISGIDDQVDALTTKIRLRLQMNDPLQIVTYRSYGTPGSLYIKGRLLEDKGISKPAESDTLFHTLLDMYRRFESDEVPGGTLKVSFEDKECLITTDKEGYFVVHLQPSKPLNQQSMWFEVSIELLHAPVPFKKGLKTNAQVLVPPMDAEYGIISDIDDTIIKTGATDLLAMSRNVFFHNAYSRLPFAGVSEFYKALQLGRNGKRNNPFFYVSSSPWNLYDLLVDFMDHNKIPEGPLLLRDFGWEDNKLVSSGHMGHKMKEIEQVLGAYPQLQFVLIGDSGQEDPKIYREVVRKFPGRILAVYIRDVQLPDRGKIAMEISREMEIDKVEMVLVDNTVEAAEHAARIGLLYKEAIPVIEKEKQLDKAEIPGKEEVI